MSSGKKSLIIAKDMPTLATRFAQIFLESAVSTLEKEKRFTVALSGGSTPLHTFPQLVEPYYKSRIPWDKTHFFWGDERCVAPDHNDSNYKLAQTTFLSKATIPSINIHRMPGEVMPAHDGARAHENELKMFFRYERPYPKFDLIILGLGDDGHTASLFPGTAALHEFDHWVVANNVEKLSSWRLTLTFPVLNKARKVLFLVSGESKAAIISEIFRDDHPLDRYPAQRVNPSEGELIWLLDKPAASKLKPNVTNNALYI